MDAAIYVAYLVTFTVPAAWWARRRMRYERVRWSIIEAMEPWLRIQRALEVLSHQFRISARQSALMAEALHGFRLEHRRSDQVDAVTYAYSSLRRSREQG